VRVDLPDKSILAIQPLVSELAQSVEVDTPDMLAHRALDQLRIRAGRSSGVSFSTHDKTDKRKDTKMKSQANPRETGFD
jgi:hypothetical protein